MAVTDARVKFLRGQLANLPVSRVDGNVYVATDERAMYVDYKDGNNVVQRIRLGDFLQFSNWNAIQSQSGSGYSEYALYYAEAENILCKWDGTNWKQINAQKSFTDMLDSMSYGISAASNTATIALHVTTPDTLDHWLDDLTYKIQSANTNALGITTTTDASNHTVISLRAKDVVLKNAIETVARTYTQNDATVSLYEYESGTDASGNSLTKPNSWANTNLVGSIMFKGEDDTRVSSEIVGGQHTVKISTKLTYGLSFDANGVLTFSATNEHTTIAKTATITPTVKIGKTGAVSTYNFDANAIMELPVYTITQTDSAISDALKAANAMTYRGTLGTAQAGANIQALPLTVNTVKIGDTYKVISGGTYIADNENPATTYTAVIGDMFIATSTDGTEEGGYILPSKISWTYIPSGNDEQAADTIIYDSTNKQFYLDTNSTQNGAAWKIGSGLDATSNGLLGPNEVVTIRHADITTTGPTADSNASAEVGCGSHYFSENGISFTAITGLTISNGHVTAINTGTFTVGMQKVDPSLSSVLLDASGNTVSPSASAAVGRVNLKSIITYADSSESVSTSDIKLKSSSLTFRKASTSADLEVDLLWETF